ncbi:transmembrane domain-containing protein [Cryptosporidium canis]|uniref:Transmembrane domain-containing protein n=1 Tax=Cryptosporidium canis TaxID=195482 RepID=A0A9D5HV94_9CRYT|nr:transmembrane domain-containing protein [Cryptosporidium canis]
MDIELTNPLLESFIQERVSCDEGRDRVQNDADNCQVNGSSDGYQPNEIRDSTRDRNSRPPNILMENGTLNIMHHWDRFSQFFEFCLHDRFHVMLSMNWVNLILFVFFIYIMFVIILACIHLIITLGDAAYCIGSDQFGKMEYFFFAVETMFSIGYGSPRSPSCLITNCFTPIMVICGTILNSVTIGIFFTKFSESTSRKWAICFSKELCGIGLRKIPSEEFKPVLSHPSCPSISSYALTRAAEATCDDCPFIISFRLLNISQEPFFSPDLKIFVLIHTSHGPFITEINSFKLDVPLEFMETPITVSIYSNHPDSPLNNFTIGHLRNQGHLIELMVLLRFFDNRTSKNLEVRKTWKLNNIFWGYKFSPIIKKQVNNDKTMYQVGISDVDNIEPVISGTPFG